MRLGHDDAVHHGAHNHGPISIERLPRRVGAHVAETHGGEDRQDLRDVHQFSIGFSRRSDKFSGSKELLTHGLEHGK